MLSCTARLFWPKASGKLVRPGITNIRRRGTLLIIVSLPNQVPVRAPQMTVAPPKTYISALRSLHFLLFRFNAKASTTSKRPYPASPMIMAKNKVMNTRKYLEISFSLYPGTSPSMSKRGCMILIKPLCLILVGGLSSSLGSSAIYPTLFSLAQALKASRSEEGRYPVRTQISPSSSIVALTLSKRISSSSLTIQEVKEEM